MSSSPKSIRGFRKATPDDIEEVFDLAVDCWRKVGSSYKGVSLDAESVVITLERVIKHGTCLIGRGALAAGSITTFPWNYRVKVGNIMVWNFTTPKGALILPAIIREFEKQGATHISCASHFPDNRIGDLYRRYGLDSCEIQWFNSIREMKPLLTNPQPRGEKCPR